MSSRSSRRKRSPRNCEEGEASKASVRGRLHPASPVEGATPGVSERCALGAGVPIPASKASERGRLHPASPVEGATPAPIIDGRLDRATVGVCMIRLRIPENGSLKGKRQVLLSLKAKIKNRFNVSVAELGDLDLWQSAVLGVTCIANDRRFVNEQLDKVVNLIRERRDVEILDVSMENV